MNSKCCKNIEGSFFMKNKDQVKNKTNIKWKSKCNFCKVKLQRIIKILQYIKISDIKYIGKIYELVKGKI